jgi:protein-disulfide isomerase
MGEGDDDASPLDDLGASLVRTDLTGPARLGAGTGGNEVDRGPGSGGPVPVFAADPSWGSPKALVTMVEFADLECPFCAKATVTLGELRRIYGKDQLRIVWKNNPLPMHKGARPAARAAIAVFQLGGAKAFWAYHDALYAARIGGQALDPQIIDGSLPSGIARNDVDAIVARGEADKKIDLDMALGRRAGVTGTPAFFVNGILISGAVPLERIRGIIDRELPEARQLVASGVAPEQVYASRSVANFQVPSARPASSAGAPVDSKTVWRVPVDGSPVRGKSTALVTMVMFTDYECPFCVKVLGTVDQLMKQYGDKLRVVHKNNPLPFHKRAEPAAELALEARAQKGDAAFWAVNDLLFAKKGQLGDAELEAVAREAGLDVKRAMAAIATAKHAARIEQDQTLAADLKAGGTPHFFINGRRVTGAQAIEIFTAIIDEEIPRAEALITKGTAPAKVYDALQANGKAGEPLEKVQLPAPSKDNPSRGPANAKVVIQIFSDFECPFCQKVSPVLREVEAAFPGKIRVVWRQRPLAMHRSAALAAEASVEAFKQKGSAGFWAMHDLLFEDQSNLDRASLEQKAATVGLDRARFAAALDGRAHRAAVEADGKVADAAGLTGTPAFVINGYVVKGAQPLHVFKRMVKLALKEAR